jgi:hypothetical protein
MQSANWARWATPGFTTTGLATLTAVVAVVVAANPAAASETWQFNADTQQLVFSLPKGVTPRYHLAAEPARIVLDLPNTSVDAVSTQPPYSGAVQQIRAAQFQPDLARIVLQLSPEVVLAPGQVELQPLPATSPSDSVQRWALRPLLVGPSQNRIAATPESIGQPALLTNAEPAPAQPTVAPAPAGGAENAEGSVIGPESSSATEPAMNPAASPAQIAPVAPAASPLPVVPSLGPARREPVALAPNMVLIPVPTQSSVPAAPSTPLPPLEPGAVEIPVELPTVGAPVQSGQAQMGQIQAGAQQAGAQQAGLQPEAAPPVPSTMPQGSPAVNAATLPQPTGPVAFALPTVELELATGTAATLAVPGSASELTVSSARPDATRANPVIPTTGTLSFPTPSAIAVNVPALSTVPQIEEPASGDSSQPGDSPEASERPSRAERRARQQAVRSGQADSQAAGQQAAKNQPEVQTDEQQAAGQPSGAEPVQAVPQTASVQIIPFGQPLPQ